MNQRPQNDLRPSHRLPCPRRRRTGFSLMELLVVVGVILALIAIAVVAMKTLVTGPNENVTRTALNNAQSLLTESV